MGDDNLKGILKERNDKDVELICTTRFARIFKYKSKYAIKCIEADMVIPPHNPEFELSILKKLTELNNPNIIKLLEYQEVKVHDELELCFEWYPSTLSQFMQSHWNSRTIKKKFNPYYSASLDQMKESKEEIGYWNVFPVNTVARDFFNQIIVGLDFLHLHGIIHRDLKPENILMSSSNPYSLVITDFGISYDQNNTKQVSQETEDNKICDISTSFYKAPELLFSVKNYSTAVDVWSLAIIISQWFMERGDSNFVPAIFDNGSNEFEEGSDIRLIMSIFEKVGIPSLDEWDEINEYGSKDAFVGLFGDKGNDNYLFNKSQKDQETKLIEFLPGLNNLLDSKDKELFINCLLGMLQLNSNERWNVCQIKDEISRLCD